MMISKLLLPSLLSFWAARRRGLGWTALAHGESVSAFAATAFVQAAILGNVVAIAECFDSGRCNTVASSAFRLACPVEHSLRFRSFHILLSGLLYRRRR